jgi:hypothetical protein
MGRLPDIDEATLSSDARRVHDEITRVRGQVRGPFAVWLRNPELAEYTLRLQDLFASRVKLERRLVQLMILVSARLATAHLPGSSMNPMRSSSASRPISSKPFASGAHRTLPTRMNASSMTSPWSSTAPARSPKQRTDGASPCSENRRWLNSLARWAFT